MTLILRLLLCLRLRQALEFLLERFQTTACLTQASLRRQPLILGEIVGGRANQRVDVGCGRRGARLRG